MNGSVSLDPVETRLAIAWRGVEAADPAPQMPSLDAQQTRLLARGDLADLAEQLRPWLYTFQAWLMRQDPDWVNDRGYWAASVTKIVFDRLWPLVMPEAVPLDVAADARHMSDADLVRTVNEFGTLPDSRQTALPGGNDSADFHDATRSATGVAGDEHR